MIQFHTITLNDVPLVYAEAAGPGPALVILHGLSGSHAEFLHLVPELARQAHVYLLDLRGHGRSGWTESGYQIPDYGRDVIAFLQQVVGRPVIMLGHSLGGLITVWLAAHKPHLLQGMILEDPGLYILQMPRFGETWFYSYFTALRDYLKRYHSSGANLEEMIAYVGQAHVDEAHTWLDMVGPEAVRERALQLHQMDPAILEPTLTGTLFDDGEDLDQLLAEIRCPAHLIAAQPELGSALEPKDIDRVMASVSGCTHTVIEGAGHDIHLDQPRAFLREIRPFLKIMAQSGKTEFKQEES